MKATNNNQQQPTTVANNIIEALEVHDIKVIDSEVLNPRSLREDYHNFVNGSLDGINFIQVCILEAIFKEDGLILNESAIDSLETAYQLANNNNVPRKKG